MEFNQIWKIHGIQFCDIEENEAPAMIMTYTKDGTEYVNTYKRIYR